MSALLRYALGLALLLCAGCTGGTYVQFPTFPSASCPTCWDDLYQGSDPPRPR